MSTYPEQSRQDHINVTRGMVVKTVQMLQGAYYVIGGLIVAFFIGSIQGPADHPRPGSELWLVRIVAIAVAGVGVAFFLSGRRPSRPFIPAGLGMWVALALLAQDAAGMAIGVLPATFLLDAVLEFGFVVWWVTMMFACVHRRIDESAMLPP